MTAPVFLVPAEALHSDVVVVDGDEGHHAARVLRVRAGEAVVVTDGRGASVEGVVHDVDGGTVRVSVLRREQLPLPQPRIVVAQAVPKGDRAELAVQLMTEVGVDVVVPWMARRCEVRWDGDRAAKARARWQRTADAATKQARRRWALQVDPPATTADLVERVGSAAGALVLDAEASQPLSGLEVPSMGDVLLVVGPEGGLDPDEVGALEDAGAVSCRLGPTVLRTSSAGAVAAALLLAATARWALTP